MTQSLAMLEQTFWMVALATIRFLEEAGISFWAEPEMTI